METLDSGQNWWFLCCVTLKFDGGPWKTIAYLFYATLTHWGRVTHICVSKLTIIGSDNGLSPGLLQAIIWTNAEILFIGPLEKLQWNLNQNSYVFIQENVIERVDCEMAAILSGPQWVKLCASFQSHRWIQTGVTIWKHSIQVKISDILYHVTLKFNGWPWKTIGHLL